MSTKNFHTPLTVDEAVATLQAANGTAAPLAGGTDLLVQLRLGSSQPDTIVDLKRIPELTEISFGAEGLRLGAALCTAALGENTAVKHAYPGLVEAAELIGSTQIQGRASVGGNLCNGSPAADSVPALIALKAMCEIAGPNGRRELPVAEFLTGPGENLLAQGEFLVALKVASRPPRSADAYLRFIPRTEMDIAVAGAGVDLTLDADGTCTSARVALGAVGPTVLLCEAAAQALVGSKLDDAALSQAAKEASATASPIDDKRGTVDFRRRVVGVLTKRAAAIAAQRAAERT
jgi:carbon-monoxide dehydrogenase medium subunit